MRRLEVGISCTLLHFRPPTSDLRPPNSAFVSFLIPDAQKLVPAAWRVTTSAD